MKREPLCSPALYLTSSQLLLSQTVSSGVLGTVLHRASSQRLIDLLAFLFISLSPGCKCDTRGTISGIAECQQVGLLLSASQHPECVLCWERFSSVSPSSCRRRLS